MLTFLCTHGPLGQPIKWCHYNSVRILNNAVFGKEATATLLFPRCTVQYQCASTVLLLVSQNSEWHMIMHNKSTHSSLCAYPIPLERNIRTCVQCYWRPNAKHWHRCCCCSSFFVHLTSVRIGNVSCLFSNWPVSLSRWRRWNDQCLILMLYQLMYCTLAELLHARS